MDNKKHGLKSSEIEKRREEYGKNIIPEALPETFFQKFLEGFKDPMILLLLVIAGIMTAMFLFGQANISEPLGIFSAILIVTFISAKTEMSSDKEYRKLKDQTKKDVCKVYRDGVIALINAEDIVVGDIISIQSGDKIHADGVLRHGSIKVDNSSLNGETEECKKLPIEGEFFLPDQITGDTFVDEHSLFSGTVVVDGEGVMEVQRVGIGNEKHQGIMMGKMAEDMQVEDVDSPLKVKLSKLAGQISKFGYIGAIIITIVYMIRHIFVAGGISAYIALPGATILANILQALSVAIVIVVCAVPEGLPLMIAIVLMQNTKTMLQHNVLVRKPIGIETAGSIDILFSDKTGTITKGALQVVEFFDGAGEGNNLNFPQESAIKHNLDFAIAKNTSAKFDAEGNIIGGNATDKALLGFITRDVCNKLENDENLKITSNQTFNSANKYSSSYIETLGRTFYKGAPEKFLGKAKFFINDRGDIVKIDNDVINKKINELAERSMRILTFAYSEKPLVENEINDDIVIIGFVGIRDDVRPEAKEAICEVQNAGVQVVMITGDRKETAVAIAKESGLLQKNTDLVFTSEEIAQKTDEELKVLIPNIRVIARALPTDKSRMVKICQEMNKVVGMTGDGVNDSPALKRADVGFAMGSGTDVAKEVSEIVILDDNFKSIKDAILYGRTIYKNILKFIRFQLTINVSAVFVSAIMPFLGVEEPLTISHMLFINLVMDSLGALLLGGEPARETYMNEKPVKRDASIISRNIFAQFVTMGLYVTIVSIIYLLNPFFKGFFDNNTQFMTSYFAIFVFMAIFNGFNVRTDKFSIFAQLNENKNFMKVWLSMFVATVFLCVIGGPIGAMFNTTRFGIKGWILVLLISVTIIPVDLLRKAIFRTYKND